MLSEFWKRPAVRAINIGVLPQPGMGEITSTVCEALAGGDPPAVVRVAQVPRSVTPPDPRPMRERI